MIEVANQPVSARGTTQQRHITFLHDNIDRHLALGPLS
jgi:hypothetical protein